jgi:hypothetical protein
MIVLSNTSASGKEAVVIHFFKFFNILAWENSINMNEKFPDLKSFRLRPFNSITYSSNTKEGAMAS